MVKSNSIQPSIWVVPGLWRGCLNVVFTPHPLMNDWIDRLRTVSTQLPVVTKQFSLGPDFRNVFWCRCFVILWTRTRWRILWLYLSCARLIKKRFINIRWLVKIHIIKKYNIKHRIIEIQTVTGHCSSSCQCHSKQDAVRYNARQGTNYLN